MQKIYKLALVEDEESCIRRFREQVVQYAQERGICMETVEFSTAEQLLSDYRPGFDLIFMDILLPGMNGMEGARRLRKLDATVTLIFFTSMAQFAVQGYEVGALDYLVKPVTYRNLAMKLDRALEAISRKENRKIPIATKEGTYAISVNEILYIEVYGHHLLFCKTDGTVLDICGSLAEQEEQLKAWGFLRCARCYLVNMRYVDRIDGRTVRLTGGKELQISKRKHREITETFLAYWQCPQGEV